MLKKIAIFFFLTGQLIASGQEVATPVDTTQTINYWQITERTGEIIPGKPDTALTEYYHRTNVEGHSVAMAYLGNLGLPAESRIFFERPDRSHFMFDDPFYIYAQAPGKFNFSNTKTPHSNISYQRAGSRQNMEERLQALLSINFGKKLNVGANVDYLYARGFYSSQSSKHLEWVFFGNYLSDRHQMHLFINPSDYTNAENGGITDDRYISHPDYITSNAIRSQDIETHLDRTWSKLKGNRIYLNYHYNLGFERNTEQVSEEGDTIKDFIPVSAIIYTFDYKNKKKRFYTQDSLNLDNFYNNRDNFFKNGRAANDSTSYWMLSNTLALSMREGFSSWAKFDLTAFITQDFRSYTMMDTIPIQHEANQRSTYVGGELSKRKGKILRYDAKGSLGVLGDNLGDMELSGHIQTRIPILKDTAFVDVWGHIKNLSPTYYENHYRSKYFEWENNFSKVKKVYLGGELTVPHTKTKVGLGVENVTNYIYFDPAAYPKQHSGNIQVLALRAEQNLHYKAFHWNNQAVFQQTSDKSTLPLPDLSLYSTMFIEFKVSKVLTVQMGANVHYWTKYYAPAYEPATQMFRLQHETLVGNYPLISGFLNCHLKQTRFFLEYYNAGAAYINPPEYFSVPHYPVNPTILKLGLSVDFIN
ncbi:MAG: putative porin [Dysgonamonadaceae bacterium]|jgi:hypothetical protein|nr:putative porin [Dysgonamonadaceae bacterium]